MTGEPLSFGMELRRRRVAAGLSLSVLAELVHYSKSHLSKIETGAKAPSAQLARQCDAVLGGNGELVALAAVQGAPEASSGVEDSGEVWLMSMSADGGVELTALSRRMFLAMGVTGLARWSVPAAPAFQCLDEADLNSFRTIFNEVRRLGQTASPAVLVPMLVGHVHALTTLAARVGPGTRDTALVLAARFAEFTGWMAQEAGDDSRAIWWTERAVQLASEGGDSELEAYAHVRRALVALYRHDPTATTELAERAQAGRVNSRIRGLAAQREAQGHALAGDYELCMRALDRAAKLQTTGSGPGGEPVIGTTNVADPVAMVTGWCLFDLGRPERAAEVLLGEVGRIPERSVRARARYGTRLALALASMGDISGACAAVEPFLGPTSFVDSATVRVDLAQLARTLRRWPTDPVVQRIAPQLNAALHIDR
jgi:hypothetical protein